MKAPTLRLAPLPDGFELWFGDLLIARHTAERPFLEIGTGRAEMGMYRGNFDIKDSLTARFTPTPLIITGPVLRFGDALTVQVHATHLTFTSPRADINRFWFHLHAEPSECLWGGGEQMSYFNLRGRRFPLWTSEPGVGRDKSSEITQQADAEGQAGGDYFTTNAPQPTYLSSRRLAVHAQTTAYSVFDFTEPDHHTLEFWAAPDAVEFFAAPDFLGLVQQMAGRFGHPPRLADWAMQGAIIGLKEGERSFERLDSILASGAIISGLWCEDWAGIRQTSFGTRLFWDWQWNATRYPNLPARIADLAARGIRFLGYASPYLCVDGTLYPQAASRGLLARTAEGKVYHVDFGEFECGVVDFTLPAACDWFAETVLRENMMGIGLSGWMADFGEYLPVDAVLAHGDAMLEHNDWPRRWAEVNARATADRPDIVFFMRSGFTGSQAHCRLLWAGDQCVDFSRHDGIGTVIAGALSAGLLGHCYHHSDIGGYTSLYGLKRTPELFMRWTEMACFTPVMRTHEGNRPRDNLQLDENAEVLAHFARFTRIHARLLPLLQHLADEAAQTGLPVQRAMFLHFPEDRTTYAIQDQYLLGPDLLVAPVITQGATSRTVYLPVGCAWVHGWTGACFAGGTTIEIAAPIGMPPVFFRDGAAFHLKNDFLGPE